MNVIHRTTLQFIASANEPDFPEPTWKWDPDMSQVLGLARNYWKWDPVAERPVPMTAGEQSAVNAAKLAASRDAAAATLTQVENVLRAVFLIILDEFNLHTAKVNSILTAIDANATLANIRTAIAAIPDLSARTEQQLRTAIRNRMGT